MECPFFNFHSLPPPHSPGGRLKCTSKNTDMDDDDDDENDDDDAAAGGCTRMRGVSCTARRGSSSGSAWSSASASSY